MRNSEADIAIDVLNKLIAQELEAARAGQRYGNRPLEESASIRYHTYINAKDKIREVCADCMWRLKFSPVRAISLDAYRLVERWRLSQSEADE
nr:MAG TPA: hypothetical protein [Caudoviricetes sp.]